MKLSVSFEDGRGRFAARLAALAEAQGLSAAAAGMLIGSAQATGSALEPNAQHGTQRGWKPLDTADPVRSPTLIVPGLLGDSVRAIVAPLAVADAALDIRGYDVEVAWVSGRSGSDRNAASLYPQVMDAADRHGGPVHLIGYSKGCADALHLLANHPECHSALRSVVSLAGVVGGTPLAAHSPGWLDRLVQYLPLPGVAFGDGLALDHLAPEFRRQWLEHHTLPGSIRYASVVAAPTPDEVSRLLRHSYRRLAAFDPHNDSQVIASDAIIPGSELLAVVNADHWAIALPISQRLRWLTRWLIDENDFPRSLLLQAIIDHLDSAH